MKKSCKEMLKRAAALALSGAVALSLAGCGQSGSGAQTGSSEAAAQAGDQSAGGEAAPAAPGEKVVNVGVTSSLNTLNPLLMDGVEINKYATGLMFLPLVELSPDMEFEGMLADSITAEDERNFLVHIDEDAVWSDGQPVTADDVVYTALRLCSPVIGNTAMMYYVFEGVGDDGHHMAVLLDVLRYARAHQAPAADVAHAGDEREKAVHIASSTAAAPATTRLAIHFFEK